MKKKKEDAVERAFEKTFARTATDSGQVRDDHRHVETVVKARQKWMTTKNIALEKLEHNKTLDYDVQMLEGMSHQAMIETCIELKIDASRDPRSPGVFCRTGQLGWIASGVRNWITHQGLFLNVAPAMHLLRLVAGDPDLPPATSLSAARTRPVSMHATREHLVRHLVSQLGYQDWHLYTGHPLLTRTRKKVHVPA